ncbi:hypothetical protein [Raoultella terrigena]|jgi:uncharacterized Zn finger protein (UPF0148 family)|uniref:hypothetical protein n=1 Tax=Raoultella terrigena TaxID=577 RepID=UPI001F1D19AE|nr:hypothetical protein [Raoultella terrigena]
MTDITELAQMKGQKVEGSYYLAECTDCGKMYPSNKLNGGEPLFSGDYGECYCPHCNADDAAIGDCGDTAAIAWNYQQGRIDALVEALEKAQAKNALVAGGIEASTKLHERIAELDAELEREREKSRRVMSRIAELESRTVTVKLPPLNDDLISILGRPNFMCAHLAELLRKSGEDIKRKSEHEQAAIIHWFLGIYLEHGDKWEGIAKSDIQARAAGIKWEAE